MKKVYMLAMMLGLFQISSAQKASNSTAHLKKNPLKSGQSANKTTTTLSRLKAIGSSSYNNNTWMPEDSAQLYYTGDRGYDAVRKEWNADSTKSWDYDNGAYKENYRTYQTFDNNGRIATVTYTLFSDSLQQWINESLERYSYNSGGQIATMLEAEYYNGMWDSSLTTYTYTNGKVTEEIGQTWSTAAGQWRNSSRRLVTYNTAGMELTETEEEWDNMQSKWEPYLRTTNTYAGNNLTSSLSEDYDGTSWENSHMTNNTFDANGNLKVSETKTWDGTVWVNSSRTTNDYNSSNDRILATFETTMAGNYVNSFQTAYTYNSFRQVLTEEYRNWMNGQWRPSYRSVNYYEMYFPASVKSTAESTKFKVYPVPARDRVNLQFDLGQAANVHVAIYDMSGRMVRSVHLPTVSQYTGSIDVAALPAGNYTIKMTGAGAPVTQKLNILK